MVIRLSKIIGYSMQVEDEGSSPVDVARSYMKDRPPWASPTKNIELRTPTTLKEGIPISVGHDSLSLSKVHFCTTSMQSFPL